MKKIKEVLWDTIVYIAWALAIIIIITACN